MYAPLVDVSGADNEDDMFLNDVALALTPEDAVSVENGQVKVTDPPVDISMLGPVDDATLNSKAPPFGIVMY